MSAEMDLKGFTDIHIHVIPGVDDGADTFNAAVEMLKLARSQGVTCMVATPHSAAFDGFRSPVYANYESLRERMRKKEIDISLALGSEVYIDRDELTSVIRKLRSRKYPTMNESDYVLVEFPLGEGSVEDCSYCINMLTDKGYTPILAHAERYRFDIDQLCEFRELGCLLQVNYQNVIPIDGFEVTGKAYTMLKQEMIDFFATDAHYITDRRPEVLEALSFIKSNCSEAYYKAVMFDGPAIIMKRE